MARPLRIEYPGAVYHITSRGNGKGDIFLDDADRIVWLRLLGEVCVRYNWLCYGYCLMTNHYHLVIETKDANLSRGMRHLNGVYTQKFNKCHNHVGHVFQGRYKSILVEKESYLLELCRYVVLNPVRAGMVGNPNEWPWTSHRVIFGKVKPEAWLARNKILSLFGNDRQQAQKAYQRFIAEGNDNSSIWEGDALKNQIFLGSEDFVERNQKFISGEDDLSEVPHPQYRAIAPPLIFFREEYPNRPEAMSRAFRDGDYTMKEIGLFFGVHYSTVSRAVRQFEAG